MRRAPLARRLVRRGGIAAALLAAACHPTARHDARDTAAAPDTSATVAQVLDGGVAVGARVHVTGRCMGYSATLSDEPPPVTRSDWLLESEGRRVFVTGAYPPGCSALTPAESPTTIDATVAQDTLPSLVGGAVRVRWYLVRR